jgi:4-hydroxy-tetrahydrodipicolinate reductase
MSQRRGDPQVVRVAVIGLGPIGRIAAERVLADQRLHLVGLVDPAFAGEQHHGIAVAADASLLDADVALLCTSSDIDAVAAQSRPLLERAISVVSSCEVLSYPWDQWADLAASLDQVAAEAGAVIVGAGVNPGFVMDVMPSIVASASTGVHAVRLFRDVDLATRRPQLAAKMGVGETKESWYQSEAQWGHRGLVESIQLVGTTLGWSIGPVEFERVPHFDAQGTVDGLAERASARDSAGRSIEAELRFGVGMADLDRVEVDGIPSIRLTIDGGTAGEPATVARMLHTAHKIGTLRPGLRLPTEVPAA